MVICHINPQNDWYPHGSFLHNALKCTFCCFTVVPGPALRVPTLPLVSLSKFHYQGCKQSTFNPGANFAATTQGMAIPYSTESVEPDT